MIKAFEVIEKKKNTNPISILVKAIENSASREEITRIEYGGLARAKSVDVSPQRRVDLAIRFLIVGANRKAFNKKKAIHDALAEEILLAYDNNMASYAINKKENVERQSEASR